MPAQGWNIFKLTARKDPMCDKMLIYALCINLNHLSRTHVWSRIFFNALMENNVLSFALDKH